MLGGNEKSAHHTGSWPLYLSCPPWSNISQFLSGRGSQSLPEAALLCSSWSKMLPRSAGICPSLGFISELFSAFCLFALHLRNNGFYLGLFHGKVLGGGWKAGRNQAFILLYCRGRLLLHRHRPKVLGALQSPCGFRHIEWASFWCLAIPSSRISLVLAKLCVSWALLPPTYSSL